MELSRQLAIAMNVRLRAVALVSIVTWLGAPDSGALATGTTADRVLGQLSMVRRGVNIVDAVGLMHPSSVAIDTSVSPNRLYVADTENNRVVAWANAAAFVNGAPADLVIGQPNLLASGCNDGGRSASTLCGPQGVAVDGSGNLYVVDTSNNRVLEYDTPFASGTTASRVFGQGGSFSAGSCNNGGVSAGSLCSPERATLDAAGNLYVTDTSNGRVLEYDIPLASDTTADRVFGQGGSFSAAGCNNGGVTANTLCDPEGVAVDHAGNLYLVDHLNNRMLEYDTPLTSGTTADRVFGQSGSFSTNNCNVPTSANTLCFPEGVAVDGAGNVYVADRSSNRVLEFNTPLSSNTTADRVFGQGGSFATGTQNAGGLSANSLLGPTDVAFDVSGNVYVVDHHNHRVLEYDTPLASGTTADRVLGQTSFVRNGPNIVDRNGLYSPTSVALDRSVTPNRVYVLDWSNSRVLAWANAAAFMSGDPADLVIGQSDFLSGSCASANGGPTASTLCFPKAMAVDGAGNVYVSEGNRVLEYDTPFTSGVVADRVFGQGGSFTTTTNNLGGRSADSLSGATGLALDAAGNLYIADTFNNRVLEYDTPLVNGTTADRVFGQADNFTTANDLDAGGHISAKTLNEPSSVAVDAAGNLYIADNFDNRVLEYNTPLTSDTTADRVIGQSGGVFGTGDFTTNTCNKGGLGSGSLCGPYGVAVDAGGNLYVADRGNNRVLEYDTPLTSGRIADRVFGQAGSFTIATANNGGISATSLSDPRAVAFDATGQLYVADGNNRVLAYGDPLLVCGNGQIDPAEACDDGNTAQGDCCSSLCQFEPAGTVCRAATDACDVAETCTGSTGSCPADGFRSSSTVCRAAAGECDVPETCPGDGPSCPPDAVAAVDTACASDGNPCSLDRCDGSGVACQHVAGNAGAVCRPSAGPCDVSEACDGASTACPTDGFQPASAICRAAVGECDVAEHCSGSATACPADTKLTAGTACGSDGNPCTVDQCDGASDPCQHPAGNAGAVCRASAGACDVADTCTGTSTACPADAKVTAGTACGSDGNPCTVDQCDGASDTCQHPAGNAGAVCRASTGACDAAETCTGTSTACPADAKSTAECRPAAGACDVAEHCDGIADACPADGFAPAGSACGDDGNVCTDDRCDGVGACVHPDNTLPCDDGLFCTVEDTCHDGACAGNPRDCSAAGDQCRIGTCDETNDQCSGPAKPDGSACNDDDACTTSETCTAGECGGGTIAPSGCIDEYVCYKTRTTAPFARVSDLSVVDAIETGTATAEKPKALCPPASSDGQPMHDAVTHEESYQIKTAPKHSRRTNVEVVDEFGTLRVDTVKPDRLLVPTAKGLGSPPAAPPSGAADHYECYRVKVTPGTPKLTAGLQASVSDEFQTRAYDVRKPRRLCLAVNKNGEGIAHAVAHLMCYDIKPAPGELKHAAVVGVIHTLNQFGAGRLDTVSEAELCVPATVVP